MKSITPKMIIIGLPFLILKTQSIPNKDRKINLKDKAEWKTTFDYIAGRRDRSFPQKSQAILKNSSSYLRVTLVFVESI